MMQARATSAPSFMKGDVLVVSLEHLDQALSADAPGRDRDWARAVMDALCRIEQALRQYMAAADAPNGPLAAIDRTRPTLVRQTYELCKDHNQLLEQALLLQDKVQHAVEAFTPSGDTFGKTGNVGVADFAGIRREAEEFLAGLRQNKDAETHLILESVNTDLGAGD